MKQSFVKRCLVFFGLVICFLTLTGCSILFEMIDTEPISEGSENSMGISSLESSDPTETVEGSEEALEAIEQEENEAAEMNWSDFEAIGVSAQDAEEIFSKLGFTYVTEIQPIGTSTINYQMFPYGVQETPINIMVEDGKITQVALFNLRVTKQARESFFEDDILPETWYYSDETDFYFEGDTEIGVIMYDTIMYENPYHIRVDWNARKLTYIE